VKGWLLLHTDGYRLTALGLLQQIRQSLLDFLFPPRCVGCGRVGVWLCDPCRAELKPVPPPVCPLCGCSTTRPQLCSRCRHSPPQIDGIRSVLYFDGALRAAIHALKYRRTQDLAGPLGEILGSYWRDHPIPADVIVPVPLHPTRERVRGYNQAALLSRRLAEVAELPVREDLLTRVRATTPQVELGSAARRENVSRAFRCTTGAAVGLRALLIDDVCTTGATLEACSQALRAGGASSVWALTLARAL
jgi:ComF family protein